MTISILAIRKNHEARSNDAVFDTSSIVTVAVVVALVLLFVIVIAVVVVAVVVAMVGAVVVSYGSSRRRLGIIVTIGVGIAKP